MNIGKTFCSLALAGTAGLVLGLLFAPEKGSRTKQKIREKAEDLMNDKILDYNRVVINVKTKLDDILNGLTIPVIHDKRHRDDTERKHEITD